MRDVAKAAGVSRMTVSRALKKDSPISPQTREHILRVVKEMNYVPDQMAGSLSTKKSGFVAVLIPSLDNLHFAHTVLSLTWELEQAGLQILLGHTGYSAEREEMLIESMLRRRPEAIVSCYDGHSQRGLELLRNTSVPVVEIWAQPDDPIQHTVGFSNRDAARDMTRKLIAKGYRRIVFLSEERDERSRGAARLAGFVQAMSDAGLDATAQVKFGLPPITIENGFLAADVILEKYPDVDCVFCVSDSAAFGVKSRLLQLGKSLPADISVVGFGDFEISRYSAPPLSTVSVDPFAIGQETGILIRNLLHGDGPVSDEPVHISVPVKPIFRGGV